MSGIGWAIFAVLWTVLVLVGACYLVPGRIARRFSAAAVVGIVLAILLAVAEIVMAVIA